MITERFVLDEASFEFHAEEIGDLEASFAKLLDAIEYALNTGEGITRWSQIWFVQAVSGRVLSDLLYRDSGLDRDLRLLVGGRIDKIRCWDEGEEIYPATSVDCGGLRLDLAPSIGLCVLAASVGRGLACVTTDQANRRGPISTTAEAGAATAVVHFLVDESDGPPFWRDLVALEDLQPSALEGMAHLAFPGLLFVPETTWGQLGQFDGAYRDVRPFLVRDLAGLSDHALNIWQTHEDNSRRSAEMRARASVDCSRDSPNTHRNGAAMKERDVAFRGGVIRCEWHTKLEPQRNRIHYAVGGDEVIVGIFVNHLTT